MSGNASPGCQSILLSILENLQYRLEGTVFRRPRLSLSLVMLALNS